MLVYVYDIIMLVYVDNIIIASSSQEAIDALLQTTWCSVFY
jgi:hypothetical protein